MTPEQLEKELQELGCPASLKSKDFKRVEMDDKTMHRLARSAQLFLISLAVKNTDAEIFFLIGSLIAITQKYAGMSDDAMSFALKQARDITKECFNITRPSQN